MVALSPLTMPSFCGSRQPGQGAAPCRRGAASGGQVSMGMNRGGDSAMRILGCEDVVYASEPATGIVFLSELWHRTLRASAGTLKLTLFFGRWN